MDKFSFIGLWDAYAGLFTDFRREITDLYFNFDLTVSEIAAEKGISRQAVSECLKSCKAQLEEYEAKLGLCERMKVAGEKLKELQKNGEAWAEEFAAAHPEYNEEIVTLKNILASGG